MNQNIILDKPKKISIPTAKGDMELFIVGKDEANTLFVYPKDSIERPEINLNPFYLYGFDMIGFALPNGSYEHIIKVIDEDTPTTLEDLEDSNIKEEFDVLRASMDALVIRISNAEMDENERQSMLSTLFQVSMRALSKKSLNMDLKMSNILLS